MKTPMQLHFFRNLWPVLGAIALYLTLVKLFYRVDIDDAYITYRYARNWVEGAGLVFNQNERVEGFSSPAHTILLGGAYFLGVALPDFSKGLGIMCGLALIPLVDHVARRLHDLEPTRKRAEQLLGRTFTSWTTLAFALSPCLIFWSVAGLETTLHTLFLLGAYVTLLRGVENRRRSWLALLLLALTALTRPEGCLFAVLLLAWEGYRLRVHDKKLGTKPYINSALRLIAVAALLLPYVIFRHNYYGEFLPNTYFAKVGKVDSFLQGALYIWNMVLEPVQFLFFAGALFSLSRLRPFRFKNSATTRSEELTRTWFGGAILCIAGQLFFILWSGGDWMPEGRFWVPLLPFLAIGVTPGIHYLVEQKRIARRVSRRWLVVTVLVITQILQLAWAHRSSYFRLAHGSDTHAKLARWMREHLPRDAKIAYGDVGVLPFESRLQVIDLNGLTDKSLGRLRYQLRKRQISEEQLAIQETDYILQRHPSYIFLVMLSDPDKTPWFPGPYGRELIHREEFKRDFDYVGKMVAFPPGAVPSYPKGRYVMIFGRSNIEHIALEKELEEINTWALSYLLRI